MQVADSPGSGSLDSKSAQNARPPCARCGNKGCLKDDCLLMFVLKGEMIRGSGLKALGAAWHKDCFVCKLFLLLLIFFFFLLVWKVFF